MQLALTLIFMCALVSVFINGFKIFALTNVDPQEEGAIEVMVHRAPQAMRLLVVMTISFALMLISL